MDTIPASIREKRLIRDYADIYLSAKTIVDEWLIVSNQGHLLKTVVAQRVLLAVTLFNLLNSISGFPRNLIKIVDSDSSNNTLWAIIATLMTKEDIESQAIKNLTLYWGVPPVPNNILLKVFKIFNTIPMDNVFVELLPYVLEVFEYDQNDIDTAINDVRRGLTPVKKKTTGIYYTPDDVVDFIVNNTLGWYLKDRFDGNSIEKGITSEKLNQLTILDPSCGTGTFLRKCLRMMFKIYSTLPNKSTCSLATALRHNIYGVDKSPTAIDSCILVLLTSDLMSLLDSKHSPLSLWNLASLNIKNGDSTNGLLPDFREEQVNLLLKLEHLREEKKDLLIQQCFQDNHFENVITEIINNYDSTRFHYPLIYPEVFLNNGFTCVLGNPPYSNASQDKISNSTQYVSSGDNLYTLFVENMKYLSNTRESASGMVIPLSISYHTGQYYKNLRTLIQDDSATWGFFHFDRSPDSLFGDDIKTRNCILFRKTIDNANKKMYTSSLVRWNSRDRDKLFSNIPFIEIKNMSIVNYVPKVSNQVEIDVLAKLTNLKGHLSELFRPIPKKELSFSQSNHCVYFYSTAYNWLPVFLHIPPSKNKKGESIITSSLWGGACSLKEDSLFVFGCVSSTISYWLWALRGDGFHFSSQFLKLLPFHPSQFRSEAKNKLVLLSAQLWSELVKHPISKVNSGKTIINYNFIACRSIIEKIDSLIISELNLPLDFNEFIKNWFLDMVQAGREEFKNAQYF